MAVIEARGLRKSYRTTVALDGIDLTVEEGRIVGLIGPNGAGKTTALNAMLGLVPYEGKLNVLGLDPWRQRDELMRDVCFIADVAILPRWIRVWQALDYMTGIHPRFDRSKAEGFLAKTTIHPSSKVRELSKGMVVQLHLALVMAIDAKLLVLDEPTLGLDILFRKQFYDSLLNDYFDHQSRDGRSPADRATAAGYPSRFVGENIAAGRPTAEGTVQQWLESPGHCVNMLSPEYGVLGVGHATTSRSLGHYWTQLFGD